MMRAAAAAAGDDRKEARLQAKRLLELKPDFPERGRWLLSRYVKFDDLLEIVIDALEACGVQTERT
jgi:hypothetical protein